MERTEVVKGAYINITGEMLYALNQISKTRISSLDTILRFIREESNTLFYMDDKLSSKMQDDKSCKYMWLDTGLQTKDEEPIFISLVKQVNGDFEGHYYGTMETLCRVAKSFFPYNAQKMHNNLGVFRMKYDNKCKTRRNKHIEKENDYLIDRCNDIENFGIIGQLIKELNYEAPEQTEEEIIEHEETKEIPKQEKNKQEEEITIGLLYDRIMSMQDYIDELICKIDELKSKDKENDASILALKMKNQEYKRAMIQMRKYIEEEEMKCKSLEEQNILDVGHLLLRGRKILVLGGTELGLNIMKGIVKTYGFKNSDFDFETDYSKVSSYCGRKPFGSNYYAVILGACPHKVVGLGAYSSLVEKLKKYEDYFYIEDARSKSRELKMTKESFREALLRIINNLKMVQVC